MRHPIPSLLAACLCAALTAAAAAESFTDVVFVGGQSNAKSQLADGVEAALRASGRFENLRVCVKRHGGVPIRFWLDGDLPPGHRRHPAQKGLAAPNWYQVDFMKAEGTPGPAAFLERVFAEERAAGRTPRLAGLVWFHGESDSDHDKFVDAYRGRVAELRARVARDFRGGDPVPTVLVRVAVEEAFLPETFGPKDPARAGRVERISAVQAAIAAEDPRVAAVDSKPYQRRDVWHVEWETRPVSPLGELGEACGEALLGLHASRGRGS